MRGFLADRRGNAVIAFAASVPMFLGVSALGIDVSWMFYTKNRLQTAADAAALGAVAVITDTSTALSRALRLAAANVPQSFGTVAAPADVLFGVYDPPTHTFTPGGTNPNAVQVTTNRTTAAGNASPSFFARYFGVESTDITAKAIAVITNTPCFIVLDPSASGALNVSGSGTLSVPHCPVQVNSTSSSAAKTGGGARAVALSFCVAGGYSGSGFSPQPKTNCILAADPLASLPEPSAPGPCLVNGYTSGSGGNFEPNRTYCGTIKLGGSGNTQLAPGTYYFKNADVSIGNNASVSGSGVMLFFDADSSLSITSSGSINLTAPTDGPYKGIGIFQSRLAPQTTSNTISGGSNLVIEGTIYTPSVNLTMLGTSNITDTSRSGYVISRTFTYKGNSTFVFDKYSSGVPSEFVSRPALVN